MINTYQERILNKQEEITILSISEINERRNWVQNQAILDIAKYRNVIVEFATGTGKTHIGIGAIKRCQAKFGGSYLIIVPDLRLQEYWKEKLKDIDNCYVYVINSFTMKEDIYIPDDVIMCVFDEAHHYANKDSVFFSQALKKVRCKYNVVLSATLNPLHISYLRSLGFQYNFKLPLETALKLDLVIPYRIFNLGIDLTFDEKIEYSELQDSYKHHLHYFEQYLLAINHANLNYASVLASLLLGRVRGRVRFNNVLYESRFVLANTIATVLGIKPGILFHHANMWEKFRSKRAMLLHNAANKLVVLEQLLKRFQEDKVVVFTNTKKNADTIVKASPKTRQGYYSGKDADNILQSFFDKIYPHLIAIKKVDEGDLDVEVGIGINLSHQSEPRIIVQRLGRLLRVDKNNLNKVAIFINVYVKDYVIKEKTYYSQDLQWVKNSLYRMKFIEWVDDLNEIAA